VEADGRIVDELKVGDHATVNALSAHGPFRAPRGAQFLLVLEEKMRWNAPIKERRD